MAIPKHDETTFPILQILADGEEHSQRELADKIAEQFHLTPEERAQRLPKVRATTCGLGWAGRALGFAAQA